MPQDTELHKAANQGDEGEVADILVNGEIAVDAKGAQERTALHRALGAGHAGIAEQLALIHKGQVLKYQPKVAGAIPRPSAPPAPAAQSPAQRANLAGLLR